MWLQIWLQIHSNHTDRILGINHLACVKCIAFRTNVYHNGVQVSEGDFFVDDAYAGGTLLQTSIHQSDIALHNITQKLRNLERGSGCGIVEDYLG